MSVSGRTHPKKSPANKSVRRGRVYDPVYTVSSEVDHARTNLKAFASKDRIRRVPEFGCMFSSLPHHPSDTVQLDPTDPLPASTDPCWGGHTEQCKKAQQQLAGEEFVFSGGKNTEQQPTHVTVGVQTDYRESETQTDPYSPEYVVQPGTSPSELLQLAALTWGQGLPAGLAEVEMIERARAKRAWEASLPPLDDLSQLDKRRRLMEELEVKEWAFREGKIQKLQEARLAVQKELLGQRDEAQKEVTNKRLNQIYSERQKDKETRLLKIHNDYVRSLRKLDAKRRNMEGKLCAPCSYRDLLTSRNTRSSEFKSHYLDTYEGLLELEAGLSTSVLRPGVKRPKPEVSLMNNVIRPPVSREEQLLMKYKALREEENKPVAKKPLRFLIKRDKPIPRPVTPRLEEPPEVDEEVELAVIHLQKLLRGRSIQCKMFKAKENHLELIQELRTVHALQREEQELQKADKELIMTLKKQRDQNQHQVSQEEASRARVVGAELEHVFDTTPWRAQEAKDCQKPQATV